MQDMQAKLEKLLIEAENCALISKLATDKVKQELFARLADHLNVLASELRRVMNEKQASGSA